MVLLIPVILLTNVFIVTAQATDVTMCSPGIHDHTGYLDDHVSAKIITEKDFEQMLNNRSMGKIYMRTEPCCDENYHLVWRTTDIWHIYPEGGGLCQSVAYFGDQYCTNCGTVWQSDVCYRQTSGCGKYHY